MPEIREIERSIIKKYRKYVWAQFVCAVKDFKLLQAGDKIAVYIDNTAQGYLMAKCLQEIKKHSKSDIELIFFATHNQSLAAAKQNCRLLNLDLTALCAGGLESAARALGANTLSVATVFERQSEEVLFNLLERGKFSISPPLSYEGEVKVIRPMYFVREKGVWLWTRYAALNDLSESFESGGLTCVNRQDMRALIDGLNANYHLSEFNIVKSMENINLDTAIDYFDGEKLVKFNSRYKKENNEHLA